MPQLDRALGVLPTAAALQARRLEVIAGNIANFFGDLALIFGVLRNALPQIPGATFYDRMIVGVVVIVIVVMDQVLVARAARR